MLKSTPAQLKASKTYYAKNNEEIKKKLKNIINYIVKLLKPKEGQDIRPRKKLS